MEQGLRYNEQKGRDGNEEHIKHSSTRSALRSARGAPNEANC